MNEILGQPEDEIFLAALPNEAEAEEVWELTALEDDAEELTGGADLDEDWQPDEAHIFEMPADAPAAIGAEAPSEELEEDGPIADDVDIFSVKPAAPEKQMASEILAMEVPAGSGWKKKLLIGLGVLLLLLAIGAAIAIGYVYLVIHPYGEYDKIMPNVYCAGVDLGGMTQAEAQTAIETAMRYPSYQVKVVLPDREYIFHPKQEGVTLNGDALARQAFAYGRGDLTAYGMYQSYRAAEKTEIHLDPLVTLEYSTADIQELAVAIYRETEIDPTESSAEIDEESHTVTVHLGQPGRRIEPQDIYDAVCDAFSTMEFDDIRLDYSKMEIDLEQLQDVCVQAAKDSSVKPLDPVITADEEQHTIELTVGSLGWAADAETLYASAEAAVENAQYGDVTVDMYSIEPGEIDILDAYYALACSPTEPYYYGGYVYEGSDGYTLDWETAIGDIVAADYGAHLSIPMTPVAPNMTAEQMRAVLFRDRLASYSTAHTANANRTNNLTLACKAINGTVLNAGETFSFNGVVGERTAAKGYKSATVYVGTESVEELGGGICQVASTIYNAALLSEMEITERTWHQFFVTYVPGGLDATVYWGSVDFKFTNNTDYPVRINASVSGGYVNISIDGTKTTDHVVKLSSSCLSTTPYGTTYQYSAAYPTGYSKQTVSPYTGYVYEAYQNIYDGSGNLIASNYLGKSTYSKRDAVVTIGTG